MVAGGRNSVELKGQELVAKNAFDEVNLSPPRCLPFSVLCTVKAVLDFGYHMYSMYARVVCVSFQRPASTAVLLQLYHAAATVNCTAKSCRRIRVGTLKDLADDVRDVRAATQHFSQEAF